MRFSQNLTPNVHFRHLATGDSYHSLHLLFRIGVSTIKRIIVETCDALWDVLCPIVLSEPTKDEWKKMADEFELKWNLPHCCASLDGKQIRIQAPPKSGTKFFNYKNFFSIILLAICDANYNFICVDIGAYGKSPKKSVLKNDFVSFYNLKNLSLIPNFKVVCAILF